MCPLNIYFIYQLRFAMDFLFCFLFCKWVIFLTVLSLLSPYTKNLKRYTYSQLNPSSLYSGNRLSWHLYSGNRLSWHLYSHVCCKFQLFSPQTCWCLYCPQTFLKTFHSYDPLLILHWSLNLVMQILNGSLLYLIFNPYPDWGSS